MEFLTYLIDLFLHLDKHIAELIQQYGTLTYVILFAVVFAETGFVFTPFLPGDSLLFAAGAFCAVDSSPLNVNFLFLLLVSAAIIGDNVNYWIGRKFGTKLFELNWKILKKEHLEKTHAFYDKHGGKTIILARFFPIIRTFSPFVAGIGKMNYKKFLLNDIAGGILWVGIFSYVGYFFGNLPFVKNNFSFIVVAIILITVLPAAIEVLRNRKK
ncbi:MAG: DedA family protein [Ignavibacteriales bacterium]|nr:DedA family protein [Ignavibacteriales bacterium]